MEPASSSPMADLQNRWYNAFVVGLQADPSLAQIIQPTPPLDPTDVALWARERAVPPLSLTFNTELATTADFFDEYSAIVAALLLPQTLFERVVGADVARQWTQHKQQLPPGTFVGEEPDLFFDWALRHAPGVAGPGSLQLRKATRLGAAQELVRRYVTQDASSVDFSGGSSDLLQFLQNSGPASFFFDTRKSSADVSQTWTNGVDSNFYGLYGGNDSDSTISNRFAASNITVTASFQAYAVWPSVPGFWYDSSILNVAETNPSSPPWPSTGHPGWNDFFGPEGSLLRLLASLMVVDGMDVVLTSDANFSDIDKQEITENAMLGMWPWFTPASGSTSITISFDDASALMVHTITQPDAPIVIGANVLDVGHYLGHG